MAGGLPTQFRFAGQHVFKANPKIVERLKENGRLLGSGSLRHSHHPHCWRCKQPVIFARPNNGSSGTNESCGRKLAEIDRGTVDSDHGVTGSTG